MVRCKKAPSRALKPEGRLLIVDFEGPAESRRSLMGHLRHHRHFDLREIMPILNDAGFAGVETGAIGWSDLQFTLATTRAADGCL